MGRAYANTLQRAWDTGTEHRRLQILPRMEGALLRQYGGCLTGQARLSCPRTGRRNEVFHARHLEVAECIVEEKGESPTTVLVPMCTPRLVADNQIRQ